MSHAVVRRTKATRVCAECAFHRHDQPFHSADPLVARHLCSHPSVRNEEAIDAVTGESVYTDENGAHYDTPYSLCEDVNTDGECGLFERKPDMVVDGIEAYGKVT